MKLPESLSVICFVIVMAVTLGALVLALASSILWGTEIYHSIANHDITESDLIANDPLIESEPIEIKTYSIVSLDHCPDGGWDVTYRCEAGGELRTGWLSSLEYLGDTIDCLCECGPPIQPLSIIILNTSAELRYAPGAKEGETPYVDDGYPINRSL